MIFRVKDKIHPKYLLLYLTRRCNMRCPGCLWLNYDADYFSKHEMSYEKAKSIINHYVDNGIKRVNLQSNGEVLMYEKYRDLVFYCKEKGILWTKLITNGLKLDEYTDFVVDNCNYITISIDGHNSDTYKKRRGGDDKVFRKVIDNTEKLVKERDRRKSGLIINVNHILNSMNIKYVGAMISLAEGLGVDSIRCGNYHPTGENDLNKPIYVNDGDVEYLREIMTRNNYKVDIQLPSLYGNKTRYRCSMLFDTVVIDARGYFAPCCHISADKLYGSYDNNPHDFNSHELTKFRKQFLAAKSISELPRSCRECPRLTSSPIGMYSTRKKNWINVRMRSWIKFLVWM